MKREHEPSWWKLNGLIIAILAVLFLSATAHVSETARKLLELGVVVSGYSLVSVWIHSNADALEAEAERKQAESRQPWYPPWWRPGLNNRRRHYLLVNLVKQRRSRPIRKEVPE